MNFEIIEMNTGRSYTLPSVGTSLDIPETIAHAMQITLRAKTMLETKMNLALESGRTAEWWDGIYVRVI